MLFLASTVSQNFARNWLLMVSVSYAGENTYSAGKTSGFLMGGASTANRRSMLAHCARPPTLGLSPIYGKYQNGSKMIMGLFQTFLFRIP